MNTRDRRHTRWLFCYAGMPNTDKSLYIVIKKIPFAPEDATDFPFFLKNMQLKICVLYIDTGLLLFLSYEIFIIYYSWPFIVYIAFHRSV